MTKPPTPPRVARTLNDGKRRTASSRRWLERQLRDPYVADARKHGYRSRAAFKLIELDERFRILRKGARVVDLGAAPGGWTQVACERIGAGEASGGMVIAIDRAEMTALNHTQFLLADVDDPDLPEQIIARLGRLADVVLSDMAPSASGHRNADHLRSIGLAESAFEVAKLVLAPGGCFLCKVWQGGATPQLLAGLTRSFASVRHAKPPASRAESPEIYVVATGFRSAPVPI